MKKITAILLSALLVLSLAGCGNNSQNTAGGCIDGDRNGGFGNGIR